MLRILRCDAEVTQMCTPGDDGLFIVGTSLGSIYLYELNEFDSSQPRAEELDYEGLMRSFYPTESLNIESDQYFDKLQQLRSRYAIQWPTFSTDGLPNYSHFSPIRKLYFITKLGGSAA